MSVLIDNNTKVIVQGITGRDGSFHALRMKEYGTNVVGGTTPGKGGQKVGDLPVFNTVAEAVDKTGADTSVIFVPAPFAKSAMLEAADAGIKLIVCITEGHTGVISRSGTLTYEIVDNLTKSGFGQSTAIGVGGDPVVGLYFEDMLRLFQDDPDTDSIVLVGEIGGDAEERAADFIKKNVTKPVVAFISGRKAPKGKQMGHAGAIITTSAGTADEKIAAFRAVGIPVAMETCEIPVLLKELMNKK